ncbi:MAG TPA: undecaprenyldiphospho-muramoylpentapeptide beta-N-acetylglucosaminyltransferase [Armatimonadota bacterium]|nr:undecaprenyldiphospho-muramoylpentapeptide beta-N-acetylglucosaminyltransferase [Armatimonadota bacterium]HOM82216.1 undecaprenyldiphospho-muramoylpentapeptide beta-N-acetylglucosaminyltransferase [Armatimonadota bacterium]HPO72651.1 undecaprenyldiphospho-muramoylpentapeptide beta-N-acetylglucosaminyltransferase [Armatimonadota bacterium]
MKIFLTGGGTGGHVCPAIAIAEALKQAGHEVLFVGTRGGLEARAVPAAGYPIVHLPSRPVSRKLSPDALLSLAVTGAGVVAAARLLARERPNAIASTGGYAGAALGFAAAILRVPALLFEPNAIPGRTTLLLSRWARRIAVAYAECGPRFGAQAEARVVLTGTPVRPDIGGGDPVAAREAFGLDPNRPTLLVVGGSAGARSINNAVIAAAPALLDAGAQILHQTGRANIEGVKAATAHLAGRGYVPVDYLENMGTAYAAADLILCRSGASTIAEVTTCGLPAVMVPYPYAVGDHQTYNARALADAGAGRIIPDRELTPEGLADAVLFYLNNREACQRASAASRSLARPDAAASIVRLLEEMGGTMIQSQL